MKFGVEVVAASGPGVLHELTGVIAQQQGNILSVEILEAKAPNDLLVFEIDAPGDPSGIVAGLAGLPVVRHVVLVETMERVYGKRIIIMGGGAQVGQVALGAITEADRHNIRGEHISVDTIPLVGEKQLAAAVRASAQIGRASCRERV